MPMPARSMRGSSSGRHRENSARRRREDAARRFVESARWASQARDHVQISAARRNLWNAAAPASSRTRPMALSTRDGCNLRLQHTDRVLARLRPGEDLSWIDWPRRGRQPVGSSAVRRGIGLDRQGTQRLARTNSARPRTRRETGDTQATPDPPRHHSEMPCGPATIALVAMPTNRPFSTTPGTSLSMASRPSTSSIRLKLQSRMRLPLSVRNGSPEAAVRSLSSPLQPTSSAYSRDQQPCRLQAECHDLQRQRKFAEGVHPLAASAMTIIRSDASPRFFPAAARRHRP